ncbi:SH3 domain-containing protein [Ensifer adhaerens]|uniref:SH3 domain-containing protein n=1 Tax=Ensifer adhaerens TaxID=106592 RepID=UPI003D01D75A
MTLALTLLAIAAVPAQAGPATNSVSVSFREGPGTGFGSLGTLAEGGEVDVKECDDAGTWCAASFNGQNGFVSGRYLNDADPKGLGWPRAFKNESGATTASTEAVGCMAVAVAAAVERGAFDISATARWYVSLCND